MFFCATKEPKPPGVRYLPDPEPLGASPKTPCKHTFSLLQILLQSNAARVDNILMAVHSQITAAMHTPLLQIYLHFTVFGEIRKCWINLFAPSDFTYLQLFYYVGVWLCSTLFSVCKHLLFCHIICSLHRGGYYPSALTSSLSQLRWQLPSKGAFCLGECIE